jgi:tetratricopeptide (TPR) repeat protein
MADVLLFLGGIELKQGNLDMARQFFEMGIEAGEESNHLASVVSSLQGLGEVSRLAGELERARSTFRKALSIADSLKSPSVDVMREDLRRALASLDSLI